MGRKLGKVVWVLCGVAAVACAPWKTLPPPPLVIIEPPDESANSVRIAPNGDVILERVP